MLIFLNNIKKQLESFLIAKDFLYLNSNITIPIGACTFHMHTIVFIRDFLKNKNIKNIFFFETCYRPFDKINISGIRCFKHTQLQILAINIDGKNLLKNILTFLFGENILLDTFFYEDNWSAPTMCAYGYGWEARCFNLEIAQITYFKKFGDVEIKNYSIVEITIGLERILMLLNNQSTIQTTYNKNIEDFEKFVKDKNSLFLKKEIDKIINEKKLYSYNTILQTNNFFNVLDCRSYFSEGIKNMYLFEISKIFKIFFYEAILKT